MQPGWEIIHLDREVAHTVHEITLLWVRIFGPNQLLFALLREDALEVDLRYPIACNKHRGISGPLLLTVYNLSTYLSL